nr:hypothetical protein BaRGS_022101 [Batillaria attramentaria]
MPGDWTQMPEKHTLPNILRYQALHIPDKAAFIFRSPSSDERHVLTYSDLYRLAGRWASVLHDKGLEKGDILVNALPNSPECAVVESAVLLAGAASVYGVCQQKDASDLVGRVRLSRAAALVLDPDAMGGMWSALRSHFSWLGDDEAVVSTSLPDLKFVFLVRRGFGHETESPDGDIRNQASDTNAVSHLEKPAGREPVGGKDFLKSLREMPDAKHYEADVNMQDVCTVFATSGSTGAQKLVVFLHKTYTSVWKDFSKSGRSGVEYNNGQVGWVSSFVGNTIMAGSTRVLCDARQGIPTDMAAFIFRSILEENAAGAVLPVPYLQALADLLAASGRREPLLDLVRIGTQPITKQIVRTASVLARRVAVSYGSSEMLVMASTSVTDPENFEDYFAGSLFPGVEVRIRDEHGEDVGMGTRGEIHVKTPYAFSGYLNAPDVTSAAHTKDGYFRTGDIGWLDENGCLYTEGRGVDAFMHGGHIIYPALIENKLRQCPGVEGALVVGVPHPLLINELCACVVAESPDINMEDVRAFMEKDIVMEQEAIRIVKPSYYLPFKAFPLTPTEKYDRKEVRRRAMERLAKSK